MSSLNVAPVTIKFFMPGERLRPYISTFYSTEVRVEPEQTVTDWLHPEWANLRFFDGNLPIGAIGPAEKTTPPRFCIVGPTSYATYFEAGSMRSWGIGLLPLGWARFTDASAEDYADQTTDGAANPAMQKFGPLGDTIFEMDQHGTERQARIIEAFFENILDSKDEDNPLIQKAHNLLVDPELTTVQGMAERLNITGRTLDRLSRRAFGFPPKLLLRRQRFLRSLADNMLNPSQNWVSTLDPHYYDQAHFGRDFQRFMGMSASEYKAKPHPFLNAAVHGRMAAAGAGMQVLHDPKSDN
ncbi:MAG: helix-turn-helix domain-containing protein [Pseudomonadota bacterium]